MSHSCDVCGNAISEYASSKLVECYRVRGIAELCDSCMKEVEPAGGYHVRQMAALKHANIMVALARLAARKVSR